MKCACVNKEAGRTQIEVSKYDKWVFSVCNSYYRSQQSLAMSYQWCLTGFCRDVSLVPGGTTSKQLPCRKDTKPVTICLTFRNSIQAIRHCSFPYISLGRSTSQSIRLKLLARCIRNFCLCGRVCCGFNASGSNDMLGQHGQV